MIPKGKAKEMLSDVPMQGRDFLLRNGDTFTIPSLPIGSKGQALLGFYEKMQDSGEQWLISSEGMGAMHAFVHQALSLNYPSITLADVDGLVGFEQFFTIFTHMFSMGQDDELMQKIQQQTGVTPAGPVDNGKEEQGVPLSVGQRPVVSETLVSATPEKIPASSSDG